MLSCGLRNAMAMILMSALGWGCGSNPEAPSSDTITKESLDDVAAAYVRLALAVGLHDPDFVDAYYGPDEWRVQIQQEAPTLDALAARARELQRHLGETTPGASADELLALRHDFLEVQVRATAARISMLQGHRSTFAEEARELYDVEVPVFDENQVEDVLAELEMLIPGEGMLVERYQEFRDLFVVPGDRLEEVFQAALDECQARTMAHIELPIEESFQVEYVSDEPWGAYNWYQGAFHSLIQVNTDLPTSVDRTVGLACHEGYPGHHVYNVLLEKHLARDRGWPEYSVYPLYSPQSLIAEGTANYGVELAFPGDELGIFLRDRLFPLAGLDPAGAERLARVQKLVSRLSPVGVEAARRYLDGEMDADEAAAFLVEFGLFSPERAAKRAAFVERYRAYVLTYSVGLEMVRAWVEDQTGPEGSAEDRWAVFAELLSTPQVPSGIEVRR